MDMTKKRLALLSGAILIVSCIIVCWLYFSNPEGIPEKKELLQQINRFDQDMKAKEIMAVIPADEKHMFAPFAREGGESGASFWRWEKRKWELDFISSAGEPKLWKIDPEDPASFRIAWSFPAESGLEGIRCFLMRERDFFVSGGKETYFPKVQMEHEISLNGGSYGMIELPGDWVSLAGSLAESAKSSQHDEFFFPLLGIRFGWIGYDGNGQVFFPDTGESYGTGGSNVEYMQALAENDIEQHGRTE
jgi:hypothetical protein